jgi:hypothetical protein
MFNKLLKLNDNDLGLFFVDPSDICGIHQSNNSVIIYFKNSVSITLRYSNENEARLSTESFISIINDISADMSIDIEKDIKDKEFAKWFHCRFCYHKFLSYFTSKYPNKLPDFIVSWLKDMWSAIEREDWDSYCSYYNKLKDFDPNKIVKKDPRDF